MKIKRGYLYFANLDPKFGTEAGKKRPVLVIQSDVLNNCDHPSTWVLPCTTRLTPENILRVRLAEQIAGNPKECDIMIDQSRTIDNKRFIQELFKIPDDLFRETEEKLKICAGLL